MNVLLAVACGLTLVVSPVKDDERVLFYPTYAAYDPATAVWTLRVHASVFEPEEDSVRRQAMIELINHFAELEPEETSSKIFEERLRPFLYDNERGKELTVEVQGRRFRLPETEANGHTRALIRLKMKSEDDPKVFSFSLRTKAEDGREFTGTVHAIPERGVSIVSDLDDTIKISQVTDRKELMKNTFIRPFRAVPGMAELYREAAKRGVAFHYVSGSPWQLYESLDRFLVEADFPRGSFHLRNFRLKDRTAMALFESPDTHKLAAIRRLLHDFPKRRFIFVGDSGERDPEIYCQIAREYPEQVAGIFIRSVTDRSTDAARYAKLTGPDGAKKEPLRPEVFHAFEDAKEIRGEFEKVLEEKK